MIKQVCVFNKPISNNFNVTSDMNDVSKPMEAVLLFNGYACPRYAKNEHLLRINDENIIRTSAQNIAALLCKFQDGKRISLPLCNNTFENIVRMCNLCVQVLCNEMKYVTVYVVQYISMNAPQMNSNMYISIKNNKY